MPDSYKVKYRKGDFEFEIESSDKVFVESKFNELVQTTHQTAATNPPRVPEKSKTKPRQSNSTTTESEISGINIMAVVNEIKDADNHETIDGKILKKSNQLNRVLLVLYFAFKVNPDTAITTGDVESITHQLGIRIKQPNVAKCIKGHSKFFASENMRKQGAVVKYKINRKGIDEFERLIAS